MLSEAMQCKTAKLVFDRIEEGVAVTDAKGKFSFWNSAAKAIVGLDATDVEPEMWPDCFRCYDEKGELFSYADLPLAKALRGEECLDVSMTIKNGKRSGVHVYVTALPLMKDDGSIGGAVCIFSEIIDIDRAGEAVMTLRLINKQLRDKLNNIAPASK